MSLIDIDRQASVFKEPLSDLSHKIGGPLLDRVVEQFVGNIPLGDLLPQERKPSERLADCIGMAMFEGSTADLLGRAVEALWVDPGDRDRLLLAEPRFVRLSDPAEFLTAVSELSGGLQRLETTLAGERTLRNAVRTQFQDLARLERTIRSVVACKKLHTALLTLQAATAAQLAPIPDVETTAVDPASTLGSVVNIIATIRNDLPAQIAVDFQPAADNLQTAANDLGIAPGVLDRDRTMVAIRNAIEVWPGKLGDAILAATATINYRSVLRLIRLNADRSLQWPLLQISVIWRQAAFAIGIWREIGLLIADLQNLYADLVQRSIAPDPNVVITLGEYLALITPEHTTAKTRLNGLLNALFNAQAGIENHIGAATPDPAGYKVALSSFEGAMIELIEEVRFQRLEADKTTLAMAAGLATLAPVIARLSQRVRLP